MFGEGASFDGGAGFGGGFVSLASLGLNTAGEYFFHVILRIEYFLARVITSVIVSNAWNYPMQRYFVFSTLTAANDTSP